jgi:hypothetical protein
LHAVPASADHRDERQPRPGHFRKRQRHRSSPIASAAVSVKLRRKIGALVLIEPVRRLREKL